MKIHTRSFLLSTLLSLPVLPAQASVSFSFEGTTAASGWVDRGNPNSAASYVSLKIADYPEIQVPINPNDTPAQIANRARVRLQNAGFVVVVVSPTVIKVTGRVGGGAISGRGSIGENDDGLEGCDLETVKATVAFGGGPGNAPSEDGYGIARPTGFTPTQGGLIRTTLHYEGVQAPTVINVLVPPGLYPQQVDMMMYQALVQHGVVPAPWVVRHLFTPNALQPMFGLTRDMAGRRIVHVAFEPRIETEIVAMHLQSCMPIVYGPIEYGWSWPSQPMLLGCHSDVRIGAPIQLDLQTGLPSSFAGLVVGLANWAYPLPQLLNGTPAPAVNGPTLFVQPLGGPVTGFTDAQGVLHYTLLVPADPSFAGLPLCWQGFDIDAPAPTTVWLSNGLKTIVGP